MRTTNQILADMDTVQATIPEAAGLTSKSKTSVFGLLRNVWALFVQSLEAYVETLQSDLTTYVASIQVGGIAWYVSQVKAFQYGDSLSIVDGKPGYALVDPTKQIVTQAAVVETDGRLLIKAAKPGTGNENQALADGELTALRDYVRQVKYAGVQVDVISLPPDELKIVATVQYDRQVMDSQGRRLTNTASLPAGESIIIYIRSLPFNSILNWTSLTDSMQKASGIVDFVVMHTYIRPAGATDWTEFTRQTTSRAGHMKLIEYNLTYV